MTRRDVLKSAAVAMVGAGLAGASSETGSAGATGTGGARRMPRAPYVETADGTTLYYKDWGGGRPVVFVAAWALNSDMWQYQMAPMAARGLRCVAYDRRGHGRSSQPGDGYDYDTLADDLAAVIDHLDLSNAVLVGHSMAGGEVVRYLTRHGSARVSRIVLIAPTTPYMLKTADNPNGVPEEFINQTRAQWSIDFPKWLRDNARPFFVPETSPAMMDWVFGLTMQTSLKAALDCNYAMVHTDFRPELPKITIPTLIIQGDKDVSAPLEMTGRPTAEMIAGSQLKVYQGAPHGLMFTHIARLNADLIEFAMG